MSEDPRFEKLERLAYEKLFGTASSVGPAVSKAVGDMQGDAILEMAKDHADRTVIKSLMETGENETMALMAVEAAYERRREEALAGKLDYGAWLGAVSQNLDRSGGLIFALGALSALVAIAAMYGLSQAVPEGERLKISYLLVSIAAGGITFIFGSIPVYLWLHKQASDDSADSTKS